MPPAVVAAGIITGGALIGGAIQSRGTTKAAEVGVEAAESGIAEQRAARESFEARTQPFADVGSFAGERLKGFVTSPLQAPQFTDPTQQLQAQQFTDPTQQLQNFLADPTQQLAEINPIVDFLRNQGFERIEESAAAGGRLGAGGTLQDLTRFNTQLASTIIPQLQQQKFGQLSTAAQIQQQQQQQEFGQLSTAAQIQQNQQKLEFDRTFSLENQRFNQLFNVTGLGANVAAGQGTAGLQTASNIGNLLNVAGQAQAGGIRGQTAAITGGIENLSAIPGAFPNLFNSPPPPPPTQATPQEISGALTGGG